MNEEEARQLLQSHRTNIIYQVAEIVEQYTPFNPIKLTIDYLRAGVFEELLK